MRPRQRGFTLAELLVVMALSAAICAGMTSLYLTVRQQQQDALIQTEIYDSAQLVLDLLQAEFRLAGFTPMHNVPIPEDLPCRESFSWMMDFSYPVDMQHNYEESVLGVPLNESCLRIQAVAGSDILFIRRIAPKPQSMDVSLASGWYLLEPLPLVLDSSAYQFRYLSGWQDVAVEERNRYRFWSLQSRIYYIRPYSVQGDGIPSLVMVTPQATGFQHQVLLEGIEILQLQWLINEDDQFLRSRQPTASQLEQVRLISFAFVIRHWQKQTGTQHSAKQYQLFENFSPSTAEYVRQVFHSSVVLRNQGEL